MTPTMILQKQAWNFIRARVILIMLDLNIIEDFFDSFINEIPLYLVCYS